MTEGTCYVRFPALAGDRLCFVADDDIFVTQVSEHGDLTPASRLTAGTLSVGRPWISPDGALIAFTGRRDGSAEAYVVGVADGEVRRLTDLGDATTQVIGWRTARATSEVVVVSAAGEPMAFQTVARAIPLEGGVGERLAYGPITALATAPGGAPVVLGVHQSPSRGASWKRYRGGTAPALWIDADGSGTFRRFLTELNGQLEDPAIVGGRVVFVSDHEGVGNVYSVAFDGSGLRRHSDHAQFSARALQADGRRVVYQCAGECYLLEHLAADSAPRRLEIRLVGTRRGRERVRLEAAEHLGSFCVDAEARASVVEVRGSVHLLTHREGPARHLGGGGRVRGRSPVVLGRGASAAAVFVTDVGGDDALEIAPFDASALVGHRRLGAGVLGRVVALAAAPDASAVAVATHDGRVVLVELSSGACRELDRSDAGEATGLAFSPDARLLAWSHAGPDPLRQIRIARLDTAQVVEATPLRFIDTEPVFTLDGRYLAFLSARTFDPFYDSHVFDLAFASATRPYLVPLAATSAPPFGPELHGRPRPGGETGGPGAPSGASPVVFEPDGLVARVVALPVPAGRYRALRAVKGGLCFLAAPISGVLGDERAGTRVPEPRPRLQRFDFARARETTLLDALDGYAASGDGGALVVRDAHALRLVPAERRVDPSAPDGDEVVEIDLARLRVEVDPLEQWRQMLDEAGRLMRDLYFDPDMSGVDWTAVVERYRPLVERLSTRAELSELLWEMQGELGTSHAYERPPVTAPDPARRPAFLGADFERRGAELAVSRVLPGESSVPSARSPLAAPGLDVRAGDVLVAVNGDAVDPGRGPAPLLVGTADQPVTLSIRRPGDEVARDVVVVPLADERPLRYQDWVAGRRRVVHETTGGRVGYLHLPDMMGVGWAELHRDLRIEVAREALVVDLRANRGGHTSQLVLEKFARTIRGWDVIRHRRPVSYPADAPRGPLVALVDQWTGSDGDIGAAVFQLAGLGPVIGTRTWGGVVGIDSAFDLADGTVVTQPRYAFWFAGGVGWDVENHGVDPDIEVVCTPQDFAAGRDPQLERAIAVALEELVRRPAARPPDVATRPDHRPPPLGPRP